jgi:hypothetical protein
MCPARHISSWEQKGPRVSSARSRFSIRKWRAKVVCVRHCSRMRRRALMDRMSTRVRLYGGMSLKSALGAAQFKSLVSASVTGWTGLGKPVTWTPQKRAFLCFYNPKKNKDEMITTAAIRTLEVLKRVALLEFAVDPGMRTASCVSASYGEVCRRWAPIAGGRGSNQGSAAPFQQILK